MLLLDYILERLPLHPQQRAELQHKRGFSEATINAGRFASTGPHVSPVLLEAGERYGIDTSVDAGVLLVGRSGKPRVWQHFTEPGGVIIPYFDGGKCVMLRPHKFTPPQLQPQVYWCRDNYDGQRVAILAESEFKARAAEQYGYQAFGVPGISSFGTAYFEVLARGIIDRGIRDVVVLFDNEDKISPDSPRYKKMAKDRWETVFWAYCMARQINEHNQVLRARVGWIPDQYRDDSRKADIDGMLAAGVPRDAFAAIVDGAAQPQAFFDNLPGEAQQQLGKRIKRRFEEAGKSRLMKVGGRYIWITDDGNVPVSNFMAEYVATLVGEDNTHTYEIKLLNVSGREGRIVVSSRESSDHKRFRELCMTQGLFFWNGNVETLQAVLESIVPEEERLIRLRPAVVGWDEGLQHYLFSNCAVNGNGEVIEYEEDGTIILNNERWRLEAEGDLPELEYRHTGTMWKQQDLWDVAYRLKENFGKEDVVLALAWMCATALKPWLFGLYSAFPILFVFGRKSSGKSRLMKWLTRIFFNTDQGSTDTLVSQNTGAFLRNRASQMPYLPLWLDEWRNNDQTLRHLDVLRGIYDHSSAGISGGTIGTNKVFKLKCALAICGEDEPADPTGALNERLAIVRLSDRFDGKHYEYFEQLQYSFDGIFVSLLRDRENLVARIRAEFDQIEAVYRKRRVSSRVVLNYAMLHAVSKVVLGWEFSEDLVDELFAGIAREAEETHPVVEMLQAVADNWPRIGDINLTGAMIVRVSGRLGRPALLFNLQRCWDAYAQHAGRVRTVGMARTTMRRIVQNTEWISDQMIIKLDRHSARMHEIDLDLAPDDLRIIANNVAQDDMRFLLTSRYGGDNGVLCDTE